MKRFLYALVAFLSVTLLASCSSTVSQQSAQEKQTITVYDGSGEKFLKPQTQPSWRNFLTILAKKPLRDWKCLMLFQAILN